MLESTFDRGGRVFPRLLSLLCLTSLPLACRDAGPPTSPRSEVTWNEHIGPLLQQSCGGCHHDGGPGQFSLLTHDQARQFANIAIAAIEAGRMPPWPPAADCREYVGERTLPDGALDQLRGWVRDGMPVGAGDPLRFERPVEAGLRADLSASMPEPYTPTASLTDDYRCFVLDLEFPTDTWVEGADVRPGSGQVHHVLMFALSGTSLETAEAADVEQVGPGYACFGSPVPVGGDGQGGRGGRGGLGGGGGGGALAGGGFPVQLGAWVPGMAARQLPEDSAMRIPAGSRIVMQVHYNTIGGPVVPDQTSVVLQVRTTPPRFLFRTAPVAQPDLDIRAHDPASTHAITLRNWSSRPAEIASAAHHMHMLGDAIRAEIGRSDGGEECLLDIPRWDFQWQMQYQLPEDAHAFVQPGDSLTLECRYDNSAANQPSVNGVQQPPRDVTWGEGTFDEMCLMYLGILTPWTGAPAAATAGCAGAKACFDACPTKDASCLLGCEGAGAACLTCAAQGLLGCGAARCALQLRAISDCVVPCALSTNVFGGAFGACLEGTCGEAWRALTSCLDPHVGSPACEAALAGCGL